MATRSSNSRQVFNPRQAEATGHSKGPSPEKDSSLSQQSAQVLGSESISCSVATPSWLRRLQRPRGNAIMIRASYTYRGTTWLQRWICGTSQLDTQSPYRPQALCLRTSRLIVRPQQEEATPGIEGGRRRVVVAANTPRQHPPQGVRPGGTAPRGQTAHRDCRGKGL